MYHKQNYLIRSVFNNLILVVLSTICKKLLLFSKSVNVRDRPIGEYVCVGLYSGERLYHAWNELCTSLENVACEVNSRGCTVRNIC